MMADVEATAAADDAATAGDEDRDDEEWEDDDDADDMGRVTGILPLWVLDGDLILAWWCWW